MDVKEQKKLDARTYADLNTHVGILMRIHGIAKPVALARAYAAGPGGLNALIMPPKAETKL